MKTLTLIISSLCIALLCGCGSNIAQNGEQLVITYASAKIVGNNPAKAAKVIEIAELVKSQANGEGFESVSALMTFLNSKIDLTKMKPEDAFLARTLLTEIETALLQRVGAGQLTPIQKLVVTQVAGWIEDGARLAGPLPAVGS